MSEPTKPIPVDPSPGHSEEGAQRKNVWWLSLTSLFTDIQSEMIMPILPFFMREMLGASYTLIGLMEGLADGVASVLKVMAGILSDRFGRRKPFVVVGYGLAWLAKVMYTWAPTSRMVVALRVVDRIGKGMRSSPRDALLAASARRSERGRAFGLHRFMDTSGAFLGTLFTLILLRFAWTYQQIFLLAAVPGFVACMIVVRRVREIPIERPGGVAKSTEEVPFGAWLFIGAHGLFSLTYLNYALILLLGTRLAHLPGWWGPVFYLWFNFVYALSALGVGRLADRFDDRAVLAFGYLMFVFLYGTAWLTREGSIEMVVLLFALYGLGVSAVETIPRSYLGKITPSHRRGTVMGWYHGFFGFMFFLGNTFAGWLWEHHRHSVMLKVLMVMSGVTLILFLIIMKFLPVPTGSTVTASARGRMGNS